MTPARRAASFNMWTLFAEPLTLNEPVGWRCSHLSSTWQPSAADSAGLTSNGLTGTWGRMPTSASRIRSKRAVIGSEGLLGFYPADFLVGVLQPAAQPLLFEQPEARAAFVVRLRGRPEAAAVGVDLRH